ncbi:DNA polymerase/3'-5' exonuclease PolX [Candidatus Roizmanbacteria bacterium]|nr:DNA polymerase/3'-5' exonuclease PolX [Candidatus Roizmanbacteria bacterium]
MNKKESNKFSNKHLAHLLRSMAAAYLLKNENRFKIIAYENAASAVERLTREIKDIWEDGKLQTISGIGQSIASHLDEYFRKGRSEHFDEVLGKIPEAVFVLMKIPTIGAKKAYKLVQALHLNNSEMAVKNLKKAALEGEIASIPTFGEESQKAIVHAISIFEKRAIKEERMPLPYAHSMAKEIIQYLKKHPAVKRVDALGSLRRMVATIGDVDLSVQAEDKDGQKIVDYFISYPKKVSVDNAGEKKASIVIPPNVRVDIRVQNEKTYGAMLQYFTGSKSHNIKLREFAQKKGLSLSEYGIKDLKKKKKTPLEFKAEESFYSFLGLPYLPPEIREGTNEIELGLKKKIPTLVEMKDMKGDLHIHSSYDLSPSHDFGANTYKEIVEYASNKRYDYVGFAEHNPNISKNSKAQIISIMKKRKKHIDSIFSAKQQKETHYFTGLEVDILPNGKLALPEEAINYVDYLIVSIHSVFNQNINEMTKRVTNALNFSRVKILGHPTGRLLDRREGFELDWPTIFELCKKKNIALEINAWPERLDLPDTLVREAIENGVRLVINSDAHANDQMENLFYGVSVARRGWAKKTDIINTLPYEEFKKWLKN